MFTYILFGVSVLVVVMVLGAWLSTMIHRQKKINEINEEEHKVIKIEQVRVGDKLVEIEIRVKNLEDAK